MRTKFVAAIVIVGGLLAIASYLFPQEDSEEDDSTGDHAYGDPDGKVNQSDVASFVD